MTRILRLDTIGQIHDLLGNEPKHPLVAIIDFAQVLRPREELPKVMIGFYGILFKGKSRCEWKYGRNTLDFQEGSLVFLAPGQILEVGKAAAGPKGNGRGLFFHPDLLKGSSLNPRRGEYSFFSYHANEALYISDGEKELLWDLLDKIEREISENADRHSRRLILSGIELFLNYCCRFYDRQFAARKEENSDLLSRFEALLNGHFGADRASREGLLTVASCAEQLCLSPSYLSDLLKKETGKTALEHIHFKLMEKAKYLLLNPDLSISEVAYRLGFEYPQSFNKIFKKHTGLSPKGYRAEADS